MSEKEQEADGMDAAARVDQGAPAELRRVEDISRPEIFANRELSFLEFNQRILQEAADSEVPLLERLKFVAIVSANLDEFFMVRVAGLKQQLKSGVLEAGPDGMLPSEQLRAIAHRVRAQVAEQERILLEQLMPQLAEANIRLLRVDTLPEEAKAWIGRTFLRQILPMLTPLAVDPGHPFPFLKNRSLNLAIHLLPAQSTTTHPLLAVVQVPELIPRFVEVDVPAELAIVFVEDVITHYVGALFPGMRISECVPFRVIRNWDLSFDEDEQEDLLETVQKELQRRWSLDAVRLEVGDHASDALVAKLRSALKLSHDDVQLHRGPLAIGDLARILEKVGRAELRDESFQGVVVAELRDAEELFAQIARRDFLLHHPYESYEPVVELLQRASVDPSVLAIKQTLYRTNRDSPILNALVEAAERGKQVTALVELKARFDEEVNVEWAQILEEAGVHVVYGLLGLKTHCKVTLIVRREAEGVRRYVHLGTGNYNEETAAIYSDLSYFTAREDVGADIAALFNLLTGYSEPLEWKRLIVAPLGMRRAILDLIERERSIAGAGGRAKIVFKSNALVDPEIILALCRASQAGVDIVLLIRGPCALRVGVPGVSDRIVVRNVVDRFLEHSRILLFAHEGVEDVFITSTDIMPRNFDRRVEVMLPIEDEAIKRRIVDDILGTELKDNVKASVLRPDGTFERTSAGIREREGAPISSEGAGLGRGPNAKPRSSSSASSSASLAPGMRVRAQAEFIARAKRSGAAEKKKQKRSSRRMPWWPRG